MNDLTFFTNEPERNLYDRFSKILNKNTQFFDVLVGYFRTSGFYLLQGALDNVEKTRILIGIDTDKNVVKMYEEAQEQIKEFSLSNMEAINKYKKQLEEEFEHSEDEECVEENVNKFVKMIKEGKLELRIYTKQPIHAKVYIMRDFEDSPDTGRVITGSSNFSQSGLVNNLEFNVELKNSSDVKFALEKFEELWQQSVEINQDCVSTIENKTWIKSDITPYEMYVKFLYEYFKEEINDDLLDSNGTMYPDNFSPLQYQKDAVIQAKRILEKHNGVFISDVVGLGKTYICAMLAEKLEKRTLVICPPTLKDYWERVLSDFGVRGFKVESAGKLDKLIEDGTEQYGYVFVDESHRFRNAETEHYKQLHEICVGKKVVLISATPQNNYHSDIANQLYLFQSKHKSTIINARNLEEFFARITKSINEYEKGTDEYKQAMKSASESIRDKVLREVMIRRTRTEIQRIYAEDLKKQGLTFPKVADPQKMVYQFSAETEKIFETTIQKIKELNYSRYKPLTYVKESSLEATQKSLLVGQMNMGGFMKGILVKRLESSKYAFEMTLNRFIESYEDFIKTIQETGKVFVSKKFDSEVVSLDEETEDIESGISDEFINLNISKFSDNFIKDLESDLDILEKLKELWNSVEIDDKLEFFINELKREQKFKNNKLIIFTESKETAEYLSRKITDRLSEKVLLFSGSMPDSIRESIRANFDPNYNIKKQRHEYRILVTTDVLAEGMNLHRSNIIINYDLPWNPTRIMQRVGRINRVGTKHQEIFVFNFFPTSSSNEQMSLEENIISKMQVFHDILGEDSKFLTEDEVVSTHELFRRMNASLDQEDDNEVDSEISYLKIIRDIRDDNKELFEKIKNYPKKIKIARNKDTKGLLTFFRKGYLKKFYFTNSNGDTEEITFEQAIGYVQSKEDEKSAKVSNKYYELLKKNKDKFEEAEQEENNTEAISTTKKGTSNAKNIIKILKECLKYDTKFTDIELEKIVKLIKLLDDGELPSRIIKDGNKLIKSINSLNDLTTFYKKFETIIPQVYFDQESKVEQNSKKVKNVSKEIVLSEDFI